MIYRSQFLIWLICLSLIYVSIFSSEFNPMDAPKLSEKVLKDKRKKLKETFQRVLKLYVSNLSKTHFESCNCWYTNCINVLYYDFFFRKKKIQIWQKIYLNRNWNMTEKEKNFKSSMVNTDNIAS